MARKQLELSNEVAAELAGPGDLIMRTLEDHLDCDVFLRGNVLTLDGAEGEVAVAETVVRELSDLVRQGHEIAPGTIEAVAALSRREVNRIVLTRPAVEAGERLGFLPGDLMAKVDPYLRPLFDALYDMVDPEGAQRLLERNTVEVAPLAFMRGRTINEAFIILDEAQNTTPEQMKMFLTRIGFGSKIVVTGDITQVDLPGGSQSGLRVVRDILEGVEDIHFAQLSSGDVVRHRLVSDIVDPYGRWDAEREERGVHAVPGRTAHGNRARGR